MLCAFAVYSDSLLTLLWFWLRLVTHLSSPLIKHTSKMQLLTALLLGSGLVPLAHVTVSAVNEVVSLLTCKSGATKAVLQCVHQAASMWGSGLRAGVPGVH